MKLWDFFHNLSWKHQKYIALGLCFIVVTSGILTTNPDAGSISITQSDNTLKNSGDSSSASLSINSSMADQDNAHTDDRSLVNSNEQSSSDKIPIKDLDFKNDSADKLYSYTSEDHGAPLEDIGQSKLLQYPVGIGYPAEHNYNGNQTEPDEDLMTMIFDLLDEDKDDPDSDKAPDLSSDTDTASEDADSPETQDSSAIGTDSDTASDSSTADTDSAAAQGVSAAGTDSDTAQGSTAADTDSDLASDGSTSDTDSGTTQDGSTSGTESDIAQDGSAAGTGSAAAQSSSDIAARKKEQLHLKQFRDNIYMHTEAKEPSETEKVFDAGDIQIKLNTGSDNNAGSGKTDSSISDSTPVSRKKLPLYSKNTVSVFGSSNAADDNTINDSGNDTTAESAGTSETQDESDSPDPSASRDTSDDSSEPQNKPEASSDSNNELIDSENNSEDSAAGSSSSDTSNAEAASTENTTDSSSSDNGNTENASAENTADSSSSKQSEPSTEEEAQAVTIDAGTYTVRGLMREGSNVFVGDIQIYPSGDNGFNKVRIGMDGEFRDSVTITEDCPSTEVRLYFSNGQEITSTTFSYAKDTLDPVINAQDKVHKKLSSSYGTIYLDNRIKTEYSIDDGNSSSGLDKAALVYGDRIGFIIDNFDTPYYNLPENFYGRVLYNCTDKAGNVSKPQSQYYLIEDRSPNISVSESEIYSAPYTLNVDVHDIGSIVSGIDTITCTVNGEPYEITDIINSEYVKLADDLEIPSESKFSINLSDPGTYDISIQAVDNCGNAMAYSKTIEVTETQLVALYLSENFKIYIDPEQIFKREQIFSDNINLTNVSNTDVKITIKEINLHVNSKSLSNGITKDCAMYLIAPDTGERIPLQSGINTDVYSYRMPQDASEQLSNIYFVGELSDGSEEYWQADDISMNIQFSFDKWEEDGSPIPEASSEEGHD